MNYKDWLKVSIVIVLLGIGYYRFRMQVYSDDRTQIVMDTFISVKVKTKNSKTNLLLDSAFYMVTMYDQKFSYFDENSLLYKINHSEIETHQIDSDFYEMLQVAQKLYHESNLLYDISIGTLIDLWDFSTEEIPSAEDIESAMENIGFEKLLFSENFLLKPVNMKLNFGSICKGFVIDKVMDYLISQNVVEASINAGGDIKFYSNKKRKWKVGIQHPRNEATIKATLNIPDFAVATSGDYERYFILDDRRYHHILDPSTGFPANQNVSVTIFTESATLADALSTAAFVMNPFYAIELIKSFENTEAIIYFFDEKNVLTSIETENIRKWIINKN